MFPNHHIKYYYDMDCSFQEVSKCTRVPVDWHVVKEVNFFLLVLKVELLGLLCLKIKHVGGVA